MRQILRHPVTKHPLVYVALCLFVAIIVVIPIAASASTPTITEYALSDPTAHPWNMTTGPDGNIWFTEKWGNKVGYINPTTRNITEFNLSNVAPPGYNYPEGIATGPDGNIWVADENSGQISKITTSGNITYYSLSYTTYPHPDSVVAGPDGNMWFTDNYNNSVIVVSTSGTVLHNYVLGPNQQTIGGLNWLIGPTGISVGPDGNIWFAEQSTNLQSTLGDAIVKMDPSTGATTSYPVTHIPIDTVAGPDGSIWFTMTNYSTEVGKINPTTGAITYYRFPGTISTQTVWEGNYITPGPDGNMWVSVPFTGLVSFNPQTGSATAYSTINDATGGPWGITAGPDKNIWFTVSTNNSQIGVANLGLTSTTPPASTDCKTVPADANSASECSATAPGQTKPMPPTASSDKKSPVPTTTPQVVSSTTVSSGISQIVYSNGGTYALVPPTLVLGNASYTVPNNQVLSVDGTLGTAIANSGSTVQGNGTIFTLYVDGGAILAPGHSPGCLTTNQLTMKGTYNAEISGATACKSYDQIVAKESATLSGKLQLSLLDGFKPTASQAFTVISNTGTGKVNGTFAGLPEGSVVVAQDTLFNISYKGGDGNDVVLTAMANSQSLETKGVSAATSSRTQRLVTFIKTHRVIILASLTTLLVLALGGIYYLVRLHARREKMAQISTAEVVEPPQETPPPAA
jgi:streptogramin lyase